MTANEVDANSRRRVQTGNSPARLFPTHLTVLGHGLRSVWRWQATHPDALPEELWRQYQVWIEPTLTTLLGGRGAAWLAARIAPSYRKQVLELCARLAVTQMEYSRYPSTEEIAAEARLWQLSLALSRSAFLSLRWDPLTGYGSPLHRLADLHRRAGRIDIEAVAVLVEAVTGDPPVYFASEGNGGQYDADGLIYEGAHITAEAPSQESEVRARLGLCYRLQLRGYAAPWIAGSIQAGRSRLPKLKRPRGWRRRPRKATKAVATARTKKATAALNTPQNMAKSVTNDSVKDAVKGSIRSLTERIGQQANSLFKYLRDNPGSPS